MDAAEEKGPVLAADLVGGAHQIHGESCMLGAAVDSDGRLAVLEANCFDTDDAERDGGPLHATLTRYEPGQDRRATSLRLSSCWPGLDLLPNGRLLLLDPEPAGRGNGSDRPHDARVYDAAGNCVGYSSFGGAGNAVATTSAGEVWVTYTAWERPPLPYWLARWSVDGELLRGYPAMPEAAHCYALTVDGDDLWAACVTSDNDLRLVRLRDDRTTVFNPGLGVGLDRPMALAVHDGYAMLGVQWEERCLLRCPVDAGTGGRIRCHPVATDWGLGLPDDPTPLEGFTPLSGRGSRIFLEWSGHYFAVDITAAGRPDWAL